MQLKQNLIETPKCVKNVRNCLRKSDFKDVTEEIMSSREVLKDTEKGVWEETSKIPLELTDYSQLMSPYQNLWHWI